MVKELQARTAMTRYRGKPSVASSDSYQPHEIDPAMLCDPLVSGKVSEQFIGRGCFKSAAVLRH